MLDLTNLLKKLYKKPATINASINKIIKPLNKKVEWSEKDIILITYADVLNNNIKNVVKKIKDTKINSIHILPFHPYDDDRGFAITDYETVRKEVNSWNYLKELGEQYKLCFDLVLNHTSTNHKWFKYYLNGKNNYYIDLKNFDSSKVFRPRTTSLTTKYRDKNIWTTFGPKQADLNYKNPEVLLEIIKILQKYLENGASIIRFDAVAYIWKTTKTTCVHQPQTYTLLKIFRKIIDYVKPGAILLTETNFPHEENISYLGEKKAHMIYQFPLPPLLIYSVLTNESINLANWIKTAYNKNHYLNFIAIHDGIGILPLSKLNISLNLDDYVISHGSQPYEINNTLTSILNNSFEKFFLIHALMLSLKGIPAIYFNSLFGVEDDFEEFEKTQIKRNLNRKKFKTIRKNKYYMALKKLIELRSSTKELSPEITQKIISKEPLVIKRGSLLIIANFKEQKIKTNYKNKFDLIQNKFHKKIILKPYQIMWLKEQI
ncbi:MAG: alpha-amylase family glycosyl hydrolase [Candidatus Woesearchaeota archaeon]